MGNSRIVKLYGIEAEVPPGCSVARLNDRGEPYLCQTNSDPIVYCFTAGPLEIFAATVIMRWDDIILASTAFCRLDDIVVTEQNDALVARAEEQAEKWRQIRAAAIEEQKSPQECLDWSEKPDRLRRSKRRQTL